MQDLRCKECNKLLAKFMQCQNLEIKCSRCGMLNHILQSPFGDSGSLSSLKQMPIYHSTVQVKSNPDSTSAG